MLMKSILPLIFSMFFLTSFSRAAERKPFAFHIQVACEVALRHGDGGKGHIGFGDAIALSPSQVRIFDLQGISLPEVFKISLISHGSYSDGSLAYLLIADRNVIENGPGKLERYNVSGRASQIVDFKVTPTGRISSQYFASKVITVPPDQNADSETLDTMESLARVFVQKNSKQLPNIIELRFTVTETGPNDPLYIGKSAETPLFLVDAFDNDETDGTHSKYPRITHVVATFSLRLVPGKALEKTDTETE